MGLAKANYKSGRVNRVKYLWRSQSKRFLPVINGFPSCGVELKHLKAEGILLGEEGQQLLMKKGLNFGLS